jgi:hypothetical protein
MNYKLQYELLVAKACDRKLSGYSERHHVVPKCMGGSKAKENTVQLTPEEHYVAHQLLVKIYPKHNGILWSACAMTNNGSRTQRSNRLYGWLRRLFAVRIAESNRGQKRSAETIKKLAAAHVGRVYKKRTEETKKKMSLASKGKPKSTEHRAALSKAKTGLKLKPHTKETRKRISEGLKRSSANKDRSAYRTPEYREKQSAQMKIIWAKRKGA